MREEIRNIVIKAIAGSTDLTEAIDQLCSLFGLNENELKPLSDLTNDQVVKLIELEYHIPPGEGITDVYIEEIRYYHAEGRMRYTPKTVLYLLKNGYDLDLSSKEKKCKCNTGVIRVGKNGKCAKCKKPF